MGVTNSILWLSLKEIVTIAEVSWSRAFKAIYLGL